jgi:hypothetical protein
MKWVLGGGKRIWMVQDRIQWQTFLLAMFSFSCTLSCYVIWHTFALPTVRWLTPAVCPQTMDLTTRLPAADSNNAKSATIRVLVVDPEGLVTIYSPVSPSQSGSPAGTIGSDVSNKVISKVMAGHRKKINTEVTPTTTKSPTVVSTQSTVTPLRRLVIDSLYLTIDSCFTFLSVACLHIDC